MTCIYLRFTKFYEEFAITSFDQINKRELSATCCPLVFSIFKKSFTYVAFVVMLILFVNKYFKYLRKPALTSSFNFPKYFVIKNCILFT